MYLVETCYIVNGRIIVAQASQKQISNRIWYRLGCSTRKNGVVSGIENFDMLSGTRDKVTDKWLGEAKRVDRGTLDGKSECNERQVPRDRRVCQDEIRFDGVTIGTSSFANVEDV
jgi:hypothetical protein